MSNLYIREYSTFGPVALGASLPLAKEPAVADQKVAFTTSTASAAFNALTGIVRIRADAACHVTFAAAPTATTSDWPLSANEIMDVHVTPGSALKVAAIDA